jgi:tRNA 2-thiouridine synthesizing protein B
MNLHIIKQSPFKSNILDQCLALLTPEDGLLLIENGVYGLLWQPERLHALSMSNSVYLLKSDATTRGLSVIPDYVETIDYQGFVNLTLKYPGSISW